MKSLATILTLISCAIAPAVFALDEQDGSVRISDEAGNPLFAADGDGSEVTFVYDESTGDLLATVDETGAVTDWQQLFAEAEAACELEGCS